MVQRVLAVTFAQALRSAGILLLPLAFITLIAWATAGSTTGTTSDPIRAALWIWLGAHHVHFDLSLSPTGVAGNAEFTCRKASESSAEWFIAKDSTVRRASPAIAFRPSVALVNRYNGC